MADVDTTKQNDDDQIEGLVIEDIKIGEGAEVKVGDAIKAHYHGTFPKVNPEDENEEEIVFDSSKLRGQPFEAQIGVGMLIQGWDMYIPGMKVGGVRKLVLPPELAYGDADIPGIPANSTLVFEVEVLEIL